MRKHHHSPTPPPSEQPTREWQLNLAGEGKLHASKLPLPVFSLQSILSMQLLCLIKQKKPKHKCNCHDTAPFLMRYYSHNVQVVLQSIIKRIILKPLILPGIFQ